jgi:O-antigen ligase
MITEQFNKKSHIVLTTILAFFIPLFPDILPILIILLTLNWLSYIPNVSNSYYSLKGNIGLISMILFYVLYLIGLSYSSNLKFAAEILETKLAFLMVPLIYSSYIKETSDKFNQYLKSFIYGCILYILLCTAWASYCFFKPVYTDLYGVLYNLGANYFYYTYLSFNFHPSYTSMYAAIALLSIFYLNTKADIKFNMAWISIVGILSIYILLLSSKAGWICLLLIYIILIVKLLIKKKFIKALLIGLSISISFSLLNVYYAPSFSQRIPKVETIANAINEKDKNNNIVTTGTEGSGSRVFVWRASLEIFKENFLLGVGTGDSRDKMLEKYLEKKMETEYQFKLNSHSQFLNTAVSIGIFGLLSLIASLLIPFYYGFKNRESILVGFVIVVSINLLFESMFERQAGVIFYVFMNTLLCSKFVTNKNKLL